MSTTRYEFTLAESHENEDGDTVHTICPMDDMNGRWVKHSDYARLLAVADGMAEALTYHQDIADSLWSNVDNLQTMRDKRCAALTAFREFKHTMKI